MIHLTVDGCRPVWHPGPGDGSVEHRDALDRDHGVAETDRRGQPGRVDVLHAHGALRAVGRAAFLAPLALRALALTAARLPVDVDPGGRGAVGVPRRAAPARHRRHLVTRSFRRSRWPAYCGQRGDRVLEPTEFTDVRYAVEEDAFAVVVLDRQD